MKVYAVFDNRDYYTYSIEALYACKADAEAHVARKGYGFDEGEFEIIPKQQPANHDSGDCDCDECRAGRKR